MLPGLDLLACPELAVSPTVMQHIVKVESSANPYAIGVVDGQLERQPTNLAEAIATAKMLEAEGRNFSVGLTQINRANLDRYGLTSYEKAFRICPNLTAGAQILADCHTRARGDWGKAFSCYYSGNFTTGFRDGYVHKVYASINQGVSRMEARVPPAGAETISLRAPPDTSPPAPDFQTRASGHHGGPGTASYRIALRSMPIQPMPSALMSNGPGSTAASSIPASSGHSTSAETERNHASPQSTVDTNDEPLHLSGESANYTVFVPEVRSPNEVTETRLAAEPVSITNQAVSSANATGQINQQQDPRDAAFVF